MSLRSLWTLCVDIAAGILLGTVASVTPVRTLRAAWVMMRGIELFLLAFLVFKVSRMGSSSRQQLTTPRSGGSTTRRSSLSARKSTSPTS